MLATCDRQGLRSRGDREAALEPVAIGVLAILNAILVKRGEEPISLQAVS